MRMTGGPGMQHADFEILLEKRIRKVESQEEAANLERHLEECQACRQELETIRTEEEMLNQDAAKFVGGFDWDSAELAIRNRVAREKQIGIGPRVSGLLVSLAVFWPIAMTAGWLAYSAVALALVATFAYWEVSVRSGSRRLLEKAMRGGEDLVEAYGEHAGEMRKERRGDRVAAVLVGAMFVGLAVYNAVTGGWLGVAIAVMILDVAFTIARSALSRVDRHRSDLLDRGEISWQDYLLWSVRNADGQDQPGSKALRRSLWFARVRLVLVHLLLVVLMVDRGGIWLTVGGGVALYHAYRVGTKLLQKRSR
jgi:hypothetical protein